MRRIAWLLAIVACVGSGAAAHAQSRRRASRAHGSGQSAASKAAAKPATEDSPPTPPAAPAAAAGADPDAVEPVAEPAPKPPVEPERSEPGSKSGAAAKSDAAQPDGAALQQELAQLMDDLVQARERVAVIGKALFKTRVRVEIDNQAQPDQVAGRVSLRLDGAPIFSADGSALHDADRPLFDGFAAPGPHVLELEIEQRARSDESYRYTQRDSFRFEVVRERRTDLRLVLDDDSNIADDFHDDHKGEYDVRTRLKVRALPLNEE